MLHGIMLARQHDRVEGQAVPSFLLTPLMDRACLALMAGAAEAAMAIVVPAPEAAAPGATLR